MKRPLALAALAFLLLTLAAPRDKPPAQAALPSTAANTP